MKFLSTLLWLSILLVMGWAQTHAEDPELIGHWPLRGNADDVSASKLKTIARDVEFNLTGPNAVQGAAARFNGRSSVIEIEDADRLKLGTDEFSVSLRVKSNDTLDDVPGDLISQYDATTRRGWHLGLYSHGGVTNAQVNSRQLHFGIDQDRIDEQFKDHGQLGNAMYVFSLCVHDGRLYASTCHAGENETGRVFRFESGNRWTDLGSPDKANAISAMAEFNGSLYVASSKYRLAGSALSESQNPNFGGKVYRLGPNNEWISCGTLSPETEAIGGLVAFRGRLYAGSLYKPAGFFRYEGGDKWTACKTPDGKRVEALTVFNGFIYATSYDEGSVFRFDGENWEHVGKIPGSTQTYGFAVHRGSLFVSEWPQAHVFRYLGGTNWEDAGKLGQELEAMPLLVYNGQMYGGTLPLAEVYRFDGGQLWTKIGRVDHTPDVKYRRAWSMAVYQGRLFVGALPSGRVLSIEAGRNTTHDRELAAGWHHVAAVREAQRLVLYVDGQQVGESSRFEPSSFNITNGQPLRIGFGAQDHFNGDLSDVRLYRGALSPHHIERLRNAAR